MAKKVKKKQKAVPERQQPQMKLVTSDVCDRCRQCQRGLRYLEKMSEPGAIGYGVPCVLTLGKTGNKIGK
ncbi:hypothetical protein ACQCN2_06915 [Brevibacillus ginsengisoli]|uniref:hypothetical protein n=1 Tax=Brevibacillus ginsengisoli TaxID=363854 RepID=UPI003CF22221